MSGTPAFATRIARLKYRVEQRAPGVSFAAAVKLECSLDGFDAVVEPPWATFTPTRKFATEPEARAALEPQLAAWRAWVRVTGPGDLLAWDFEASEREFDQPPPPGSFVLLVNSARLRMTGQPVDLGVTLRTIPPPPPLPLRCDELVEVGVSLFEDARRIERHATKFGFAFLSLLERAHHDEPQAAKRLRVHPDVWAEYKDLCSRGGAVATVRKATKKRPIELTAERRDWLMRVFRELIQRHGAFAAGAVPGEDFNEFCPGPESDFPERAQRRRRRSARSG